MRGAPLGIEGGVHVAHAVYSGNKSMRNGLDVWLVKNDKGLEHKLKANNHIISRSMSVYKAAEIIKEDTESKYSIDYTHASDSNYIWPLLKLCIDVDVQVHSENTSVNPNKSFEHRTNIVDVLKPSFEPRLGKKPASFFAGKENFSDCLYDANIDLSASCIADLGPDFYYMPELDCTFCYAKRHHQYPS